jgi:hypothetical protein
VNLAVTQECNGKTLTSVQGRVPSEESLNCLQFYDDESREEPLDSESNLGAR